MRELVRLMLEANGYEVLTVHDADEAARAVHRAPGGVDLLLTDVVMPEVNGRELAERLGGSPRTCAILFMSGYSDEAVYRHGDPRRRVARSSRSRSPSARSRARSARSSTPR